jgi:hypothetical protein
MMVYCQDAELGIVCMTEGWFLHNDAVAYIIGSWCLHSYEQLTYEAQLTQSGY